jgi:hypothetical protein
MKSSVCRKAVFFLLLIALAFLPGCSDDFFRKIQDEVAEYLEQTGELAYPGGLSADTFLTDRITLTWDTVPGATSYFLSRSELPDGTFSEVYSGAETIYADIADDPVAGDLTDGLTYYYRVRASDGPRQSASSPALSVLFDSTAPAIAITFPPDGDYPDTGSFDVQGVSADNSGVSKVEVQVDGGSWQIAAGTLNWTFSVSALSDGPHNIAARATDSDGKTRTADIDIIVDTGAPTVSIVSPADGSDLTDNTPSISGTAADTYGVNLVEYKVDAGAYQAAAGTSSWSQTLASLSDGPHTITVRASDNAGNQATDQTAIDIDATLPSLTVTNPASGLVTTDTTPLCSGTAADANGIQIVQVRVDSGSWQTATGTTSWSRSPSVSYGDHTITVRATDTFGNYREISRSISILQTPTSVSASDNDDDRITLTWANIPGAGESYNVYRSTSDSGYTKVHTTTATSYTDTDATCNYRTTYYYRVSAEKGGVETAMSGYNTGFRHGYYAYFTSIGLPGTGDDRLDRPYDVHYDQFGYIFIADTYHNQFDMWTHSNEEYYDSYGAYQDGSGSGMYQPRGIKRHDLDTVYIVDCYNYEVDRWEFNYTAMDWQYDSSFTATGVGYIQWLDTDSSYVYVSQTTDSTIFKFTLAGGYVGKWGSIGSGNGQFNGLAGVAVSGSYLWAVDRSNNRVQKFTTGGTYQSQFAVKANSYGIDVTTGGYIVVSNADGFDMYDSGGVLRSSYSNALVGAARGLRAYSNVVYLVDYTNETVHGFELR